MEDTKIQSLLRHEDVSTTQRFHIKTAPRMAQEAMHILGLYSSQQSTEGYVFERMEPTNGLEPLTC